jgi:hypothetical protein
MAKSIVAALLCIPFVGNAQELIVQYEGKVSSIDRASLADAPPFSIGDPIKGTLRIQPRRAPTDALPEDSQIGRYFGGVGFDFITGPRPLAGGEPADAVIVYNDWEPPSTGAPREDGIIINDSWLAPDDDFNLLLGLQRPVTRGQLFSTDALEQSFDIESAPGTTMWGYIERGLGEFRRVVNFTLSRFSVTPGSCRA